MKQRRMYRDGSTLRSTGEAFIIAKAGKPLVKVTRLEASDTAPQQRLGFLQGPIQVSDDFDHMAYEDIAQLFGGEA